MKKYSMQELMQKFAEDAKYFSDKHVELRENFMKECPGSEIPDFMSEGTFSLPLALHSMCQEILDLKEK